MNRRTDETADAKLSDEIRQNRDAGLSFIAHTLATALKDRQPIPGQLNQRHPDFAELSVQIGRAINREKQAVTALSSAEKDKSLFCLENDFIASAVIAFLDQDEIFTGTAAQLREKLIDFDTDIAAKPPSAKRLGKRLTALWPHFQKILQVARQEKDRNHFTIYTLKIKSADRQGRQDPLIVEATELFSAKVVEWTE